MVTQKKISCNVDETKTNKVGYFPPCNNLALRRTPMLALSTTSFLCLVRLLVADVCTGVVGCGLAKETDMGSTFLPTLEEAIMNCQTRINTRTSGFTKYLTYKILLRGTHCSKFTKLDFSLSYVPTNFSYNFIQAKPALLANN